MEDQKTPDASNNYALAIRSEDAHKDTIRKPIESLDHSPDVTAQELDNFHVYQSLKQRENEYMSQNPTILMRNGHFDENEPGFIQFKRQNIIKWGAISQIMHKLEKWISQYNVAYCYIDVKGLVTLADDEHESVTEKELMLLVTNKS